MLTPPDGSEPRRDEVAGRLEEVRRRIGAACRRVGRSPDEVTLVVVTKYFPASDVRILADLGVTDVGENRHQEAVAKRDDCADLPLRWHFLGRLQSNKAAAVGSWADVVQSVDRAKLVSGLSRAATDRDTVLDVLVQVSLDPPGAGDGRGGAVEPEVAELAAAVERGDQLRMRGVMGVAPLGGDPVDSFETLARIASAVRSRIPSATWISAGMSGDLEQAVAAGATHVRVGSAVLGNRPTHR